MTDAHFLFTDTRSLEIRFDPEVPKEVRSAIQPLLNAHAWIVPSFVHFIFVRWTLGESGAALSATVNEEYRNMTFYVHPSWLGQTPRGRGTDVRHEFLHGITDPLYRFGANMINWNAPDDKVRKLLDEELRMAVEKVTCDLQNMLDRRELFVASDEEKSE